MRNGKNSYLLHRLYPLRDPQKFLIFVCCPYLPAVHALLERSHGSPVTVARRSIPEQLLLDLARHSSRHSYDTDTSQQRVPA